MIMRIPDINKLLKERIQKNSSVTITQIEFTFLLKIGKLTYNYICVI